MKKKYFKIIGGHLAALVLVLAFFIIASYSNTFTNVYAAGLVKFMSFFITGFLLKNFFTKYQCIVGAAFLLGLFIFVMVPFSSYRLHVTLPTYSFCLAGMLLGFYFKKISILGKGISFVIIFSGIFLYGYKIYPDFVTKQMEKINEAGNIFDKAQIDSFLMTATLLKGQNKGRLELKKNKVYLIEFFFDQCSPCKSKRVFLQQLEKNISKSDFEIVYVESGKFDNFQTYIKNYQVFGGNVFYDMHDALINDLKIEGFPFEIIVDKYGKSRYISEGFDKGFYGSTYVEVTQKKINKLIYE